MNRSILSLSLLALLGLTSLACAGDPAEDPPAGAVDQSSAPGAKGDGIPVGKVVIPGGRSVDKDCVFEAPDESVVDANGDVFVNGKVIAHHEPCTPEQMGLEDVTTTFSILAPTIDHAWVEFTNAKSTGPFYNGLVVNWVVPPAPTSTLNKIIYLFPSFESSWHGGEIIQPVLQYGGNGDFGGNYWTMASWYCYPNGCKHSGAKNVNVGDTLLGTIGITQHGTTTNYYTISTQDNNTGVVTSLNINTNGPFNTVQGGALEVYGISQCAQYPATNLVSFFNIAVFESGPFWNSFNFVHPTWSNNVTPGLTPSCNYGVTSGVSNDRDFTNLSFSHI